MLLQVVKNVRVMDYDFFLLREKCVCRHTASVSFWSKSFWSNSNWSTRFKVKKSSKNILQKSSLTKMTLTKMTPSWDSMCLTNKGVYMRG